MEDKYYVPTIEELCVGFEYEEDNYGNDKWTKKSIKTTNITQACKDLVDDIKSSDDGSYTFRVKYLDRKDIEECGFDVSSDYGAGIDFKFGNKYKLTKVKGAGLTYSKNEIRIFENNSILEESYNSRLFIGDIKNKSELKKLLKQLNII